MDSTTLQLFAGIGGIRKGFEAIGGKSKDFEIACWMAEALVRVDGLPGLADAADVRIQVKMQLDQNGDIIGEPEVTATGGSEAARRARLRCRSSSRRSTRWPRRPCRRRRRGW